MAANRTITFKVINARTVPFAALSADIAIGYTDQNNQFVGLFIIPDFLLKKSPTKGYYYQAPSKPYIKDGEHQVDEQGYKRYLEHFRLFTEKGAGADPDKMAPTKGAWDARKHIIGLLVEAMNALGGDSAEQSAPPARRAAPRQSGAAQASGRAAARPAAAATVIDEDEVDSPLEDDDDDMPF